MRTNSGNGLRAIAVIVVLAFCGAARAEDGLFYLSSDRSGYSLRSADGSRVALDGKAGTKILRAHVYSENNANTEFGVRLETSDYEVDAKTGIPARAVVLRVGDHVYSYVGGAGSSGHCNLMFFRINNLEEARIAARSLSTECALREPPGYRIFAQFTPERAEFHANEPVPVKLEIKNLDTRKLMFQRGGRQRGSRDNQYGFRAILVRLENPGGALPMQPVADVGDPVNFGGIGTLVAIDPEKSFTDNVDLKKWFAFDKAGTYLIHGFYAIEYHRPAEREEAHMPWNLIWSDYASADFEVVIK